MEVDPRLIHKSLDRRQDREVDWAAMQDLFDAQCEELDTYLSDSANPIWVALAHKIVYLQRYADTENGRYSLVQSLGILWRRLDNCHRVQTLRGWNVNVQPSTETVEQAFKTAVKRWQAKAGTIGQSWTQLSAAASNAVWGYDFPGFANALAVTALDPKPGLWQQTFIREHQDIMGGIGSLLNNYSSSDSTSDAGLWFLIRHAQQWFDHKDDIIHSRFISSGMATGVMRVLARTLARFPRRTARTVVHDVEPLFELLLRHPAWVASITTAISDDSIKNSLAVSEIRSGGDPNTWQTDEEGLRSELARQISNAGTELVMQVWSRLKNPEGLSSPSPIDAVWYSTNIVDTITTSINRRSDYDSHSLNEVLRLYVLDLRSLGRIADGERVRAGRRAWRKAMLWGDYDDMEDYHPPIIEAKELTMFGHVGDNLGPIE